MAAGRSSRSARLISKPKTDAEGARARNAGSALVVVSRPVWEHLRPWTLAALAAVLYFLSFPGFGLWPLAFVALVPLFVLLDLDEPRGKRAFLLGLWFGFITNWGGYYWLVETLGNFSDFPLFVCIVFVAVVCLYQGALLAAFFGLWSVARRNGWPTIVAAMAAFAACEMAYPLIFPSYFGNSFHDLPAFIQVVDLGGPMLLTVLAVLVNGALYGIGRALWSRQPFPRRAPLAALLAVAAALGYGVYRIQQTDRRVAGAPKKMAGIVQASMGMLAKRNDVAEGHRRHLEQSRELERETEVDLLVWPESAVGWSISEDVTNVHGSVTARLRTPVLFGGLARRSQDGVQHVYNSAFMADAEGTIRGTYDKAYLLPFGEYLPFGDVFPSLYEWSPNSGRFTPGDHVRPLPFGDYRISTLICYEDILPGFVRKAVAAAEPHLLVNITNDAWFGDTHEPWVHLALAKFRAVEHHRYLVRATNSGVSAVVDPVGRVVTDSGVFERATLQANVAMLQGRTVYQEFGDWPGWLGLFGIAFMALRRRKAMAR